MSRHFQSHRCDFGHIDVILRNIQYSKAFYTVLCNEKRRRRVTVKGTLPGVFKKRAKVFFLKTFWQFQKTGAAGEQDFWRLRLEMELRGRGKQGDAANSGTKVQISEYI